MKNVAVLTEDGAFALFFCPLPRDALFKPVRITKKEK